MNKIQKDQKGFAHIAMVLIAMVLVAVGGYAAFRFVQSKNSTYTAANSEQKAHDSAVKIKNLGFNLDYYNSDTGKAGDMVFPEERFPDGVLQMLFYEFGFVIDGNSANGGQSKTNPQPTFILPLGTKVRSLVDGEVVEIPKLYSNDYSVMVKGEGSDLIFETEHVINVMVEVGDKVLAGDVLAEVSDYDSRNLNGLGLFEIGILQSGNPPSHLCPFDYLDDSIKHDVLDKLTALTKSWEEYLGDSTIYDESAVTSPGCLTSSPVEG